MRTSWRTKRILNRRKKLYKMVPRVLSGMHRNLYFHLR